MAKMPKDARKRVKKASASGGDPVPAGIYDAEITNVNPDGEGPAGPYWTFEFTISGPEQKGRKQFTRTSFAEGAEFRIKQILEATGRDESADSDDFIGDLVKIAVSEGTIQAGPKKGQPSNDVDRVMSLEAEEEDDEEEEDEDDDEPEEEEEEEEEEDDDEEEEEEEPKKKTKPKAKAKAKAKPAAKGKKKKAKKDEDDEEFEF